MENVDIELYTLFPWTIMLGFSIVRAERKQVEIFLLLFALSISWGDENPAG